MRLTRSVEYAVQALVRLSSTSTGPPISCSTLASVGDMPQRFLLQILQALSKRGLVKSARGVVGGYSLARELDECSLLDVIEAIDGPFHPPEQGLTSPPTEICTKLHEAFKEVVVSTRDALNAIKLSRFVAPRGTAPNSQAVLPPLAEGAIESSY